MLPCLALLLLMELPVCTVAGDGGEEQTLSTEAETWITVALEVLLGRGSDKGRG
ncbi:TAC4 isoform 6 [Pongo abelii]|uniref:TAC4 isoform 6 n=1 Tax=Pongo abelii TaxID=9601 RepID=A0A2J8W8U0_PONAB|nr:TAC4 isoform 6 [Pongo abelii]